MSEIVKQLIMKKYGANCGIIFNENLITVFKNKEMIGKSSSFHLTDNWKIINRIINNILTNNDECSICFGNISYKYNPMICTDCKNTMCFHCYINIIKTNNRFICPYCKVKHQYIDNEFIDDYIYLLKTDSRMEFILQTEKVKKIVKKIMEEKGEIITTKCPRCNTYKYKKDFINDKNRVLKTCMDCRLRNKKYRDSKIMV